MFNSKTSIVTSAEDGCGTPSSVRPMDNLPSRDHKGAEYKESFMFSNRSPVSHGSSLAAKAVVAGAALGALVLLAGVVPVARASLLVYEPFNYPSLADGSEFDGITTNAAGLTGSYILAENGTYGSTAGHIHYHTSGLAFAGLKESPGDGSITIYNPDGANTPTDMVVQISPNTTVPAGGTLYGGYLFEPQDLQNDPSMSMLIGGQETTPWNSSTLQIESAAARMGNNGYAGQYANSGQGLEGSNIVADSGTQLTNAATYLVLFEVQNVNGTSGPVTMNQWILTDAQYQHFASNLTAAALNGAGTGTGASNILQSGSYSNASPSAWPQFNSASGGVGLNIFNQFGWAAYGEIRLSDGNLSEVAPAASVPEPATLGLIAFASIGLLLIGRKRAVRRSA